MGRRKLEKHAKIKTSTILRQGEKSDATHLLPTVRKEAVVWLVADGWDEKNRKKAGEEALEAGPHPGRPSSHTMLCCAVEALPYYAVPCRPCHTMLCCAVEALLFLLLLLLLLGLNTTAPILPLGGHLILGQITQLNLHAAIIFVVFWKL